MAILTLTSTILLIIEPLISRATHFSGNPTCIDHILTNSIDFVHYTGILQYSLGHHLPCLVSLQFTTQDSSVNLLGKPKIYLNDSLVRGFIEDLQVLNTDIIEHESSSAEFCYTYFHEQFRKIYDKWFVESKGFNCRNRFNLRKDWITIGLAKSCQVRSKLYSKWCSDKTTSNWNWSKTHKQHFIFS